MVLAGALALCACAAMWAPSTAPASTPLVTDTHLIYSFSEPSVTLAATLNPINGDGVAYEIGYEEEGGAFCDGQTEQPAYRLYEGEYTGTEPTEISIPVTLWAHVESGGDYCARVIASTPDDELEAILTEVGGEVEFFPSTPGAFIYPFRIYGANIFIEFEVDGLEEGLTNAEYAPQDSTWCESSGAEGSPETTAPPRRYGTPGEALGFVYGQITVTAGEKYCARARVHGEFTTVYSSFVEWEAEYPAKNIGVEYESASGEEIVHADVDPEGQATVYAVKYAPANSSFCGGSENSETGSQPVVGHEYELNGSNIPSEGWLMYDPVTISSNEFVSGERYCATIYVRKPSGESLPAGEGERVFFTAGPAAGPVAEAPSATTARASSVTDIDSVLSGSVDPGGAAGSFAVDYAPESSAWCQGDAGAAVSESAGGSAGEGIIPVEVEHEITGLDPDSEYCAEIVASNAQGRSIATGQVTFKTLGATSPEYTAAENHTAVSAPSPTPSLVNRTPSLVPALPTLRRTRAPRTNLVHGRVVLSTGYDTACPRGSCTTNAAAIKYLLLSDASAVGINRGTIGSVRFALGVRGHREIVITLGTRGKRMLKAGQSLRMALRVIIAGGGLTHPSTTIEVLHAPRPRGL